MERIEQIMVAEHYVATKSKVSENKTGPFLFSRLLSMAASFWNGNPHFSFLPTRARGAEAVIPTMKQEL